VLVVDPEPEVRQLVCRVLADAKLSVSAVGAAAAAVTHVAARRPDLVLLDLELAARDGWSLLSELRQGDDPPPIVGMGSAGSLDSFSEGVREGLAGIATRPFHMGELIETCRRSIDAHQRRPGEGPAERRRAERRSLQVAVHLLSSRGTPIALGELVDLSGTGAQLILMAPFEVGDRVRVSLDPAQTGRILELQGVVRWQKPVSTGFCHGVEFDALSPDARAQLQRLQPPGREP
jgi:DNA-binding response OmpR family regulator